MNKHNNHTLYEARTEDSFSMSIYANPPSHLKIFKMHDRKTTLLQIGFYHKLGKVFYPLDFYLLLRLFCLV